MKLVLFFVVTVLLCLSALTAAQDSATAQPDCNEYAKSDCTREFKPVCGDDGNTYPTECILCMENKNRNQNVKVVKQGVCDPRKI